MIPVPTSVDQTAGGDWLVFVHAPNDPYGKPHPTYVRSRSEDPARDHRLRALGALPYDPTGNYDSLDRDSS